MHFSIFSTKIIESIEAGSGRFSIRDLILRPGVLSYLFTKIFQKTVSDPSGRYVIVTVILANLYAPNWDDEALMLTI